MHLEPMFDLTSPAFWIVLAIGLVAGATIGAGVAALFRAKGGAASAARLEEELDTYRGEVDEHFERTSELFRDLTEKYRDLYDHLATGAGDLCSDDLKGRRLQGSVRELLTVDEGTPAPDAETVEPAGAAADAVPPSPSGEQPGEASGEAAPVKSSTAA